MKLFTKLMSVCLILAITGTAAFSQKYKGNNNQPLTGLAKPNLAKSDISPTMGLINSLGTPKAMFDLLFQYSVPAGGTAGIETDGQFFYITRWNANLFYKFSLTGTLLDSFAITGAGNIRDLAYDGQYFYGSNASNSIYKMDFTAHTLISTITCPSGTVVRHIAYDPINNAFWCGNWATDFILVNMSGTVINTIPATTHLQTDIYGSAYDNFTPGGPYLWLYRQTSANANDLEQVNIATGVSTGVTFDVTTVVTGLTSNNSAGGLCISTDAVPCKAVLVGVSQNAKFWGLELAETSVYPNDLGITSLTSPVSTALLTNSDSLKIVVHNFDTIAHTNIPVNYVIDGGAVVRDTLYATIPAATDMNFTFSQPYDFSIPGHVYDIMIYTSFPADGNNVNDTLFTTVTNQWDVATVSIDMPPIMGPGVNIPEATVINNGTMATTFTVTMNISGGYTSTQTVTNLLPGMTQQVVFGNWTAVLGIHNIEVYTTLLADSVHANDTIYQTVDIQNLIKAYGYVAYDPAATGALPQGPAYTYLQTPQTVVSLADQSAMNFIGAAAWGPMNKWYGVVSDDNDLVTIDTLTGARTVIGNIGVPIYGLAFDQTTNTLYGVSYDGANSALYTISAGGGVGTYVGDCAAQVLINLACSPAGVLYAVSIDDDNLYTIDKTTGAATIVGPIGFDASYAQDMEIDQNTGICYMAAYNNTTESGEARIVDLTTGSTVLIGEYLNNMELTGLAIPYPVNNPVWDASVIGIDNLESACELTSEDIEIRVMNMGTNPIVDLPVAYSINNGAPVLDTVSGTLTSGQSMSFTFDVPADFSVDGDYEIKVYSSYTTDGVHSNDTLVFSITNITSKTIPYFVGFEPTEDLMGASIIDNNNDGYSWALSDAGGNTDPYCINYSYNTASAADDWFISSCITMDATKTYYIEYYYKAQSATYPEKLKVFIGADNTVAAMTTQLDNKDNITNTAYNQGGVTFTVPSNGNYYIGFQCYSLADQYILYVDDINISESNSIGENDVAIDVMIMPNPATDQFTVLTSENESVITVTNALGAVVYNSKVYDNKVTVSTTGFRSGLYFVKIETEKGSRVQKVVITK